MKSFLFLYLVIFCSQTKASFEIFRLQNEPSFLGTTTFETYTPRYRNAKNKLVMAPPPFFSNPEFSSPRYPTTFYFKSCEKNKTSEPFINWLKNIPPENTLSHFIVILPCSTSSNSSEFPGSFHRFWNFYSLRHAVNPLSLHLLTEDGKNSMAFRLVEAFPELFTSLTLIGVAPDFLHKSRFKGLRIRGYAAKNSPGLTSLREKFETLKKDGTRAELIELETSNENLLFDSMVKQKHLEWLTTLKWNN